MVARDNKRALLPDDVSLAVKVKPRLMTVEIAATKIQRSFRARKYRLDRQLLIERIRLESKLKILGARLIYTVIILFLVCYNLGTSAVYMQMDLLQQVQTDLISKLGLSEISGSANPTVYYSWEYYSSLLNNMATTLTTDSALISAGTKADTYLVGSAVVVQSRSQSNLCSTFASTVLSSAASSICPTCDATATVCSVALGASSATSTSFISSTQLDALTTGFTVQALFFTPRGLVTLMELSVPTLTSVPSVTFMQSLSDVTLSTENIVTASMVIILTVAWTGRDLVYLFLETFKRLRNTGFRLKMNALGGVLNTGWGLGFWYLSNLASHVIALVLMIGRLINSSNNTLNALVQSVSSATTPAATASALQAVIVPLASEQLWETVGIVCVTILLIMIVECIAGHPKVGILTDTWFVGSDELLHFCLTFVMFYVCLGLIGWTGFGCTIPSFRTLGSTLAFQFEILTSGQWSNRVDPTVQGGGMLMLYLLVFPAIVTIILVNFFTAILIESYMRVRETVAHSSYYQSFPADTMASFSSDILISLGKLPDRADLVAGLLQVFARRTVDIPVLENTGLFKSNMEIFRFFRRYRRVEGLRASNILKESKLNFEVAAHAQILVEKNVASNDSASSSAADAEARLIAIKARLAKLTNYTILR